MPPLCKPGLATDHYFRPLTIREALAAHVVWRGGPGAILLQQQLEYRMAGSRQSLSRLPRRHPVPQLVKQAGPASAVARDRRFFETYDELTAARCTDAARVTFGQEIEEPRRRQRAQGDR